MAGAPGIAEYHYWCKSYDYSGDITHLFMAALEREENHRVSPRMVTDGGADARVCCVMSTSQQVLFRLIQKARVVLGRAPTAMGFKAFRTEADDEEAYCSHVIKEEISTTVIPLDREEKKAMKKKVNANDVVDLGFGIKLGPEDIEKLKSGKGKMGPQEERTG